VRLHAELGGQILENKKEAKRLAESMKHIEAVMKMLQPGYRVQGISVRRRLHNPWFKRGTLFRHAIDVLRTAEKPLTTNEIVSRMIAAKGIEKAARGDVRTIFGGVHISLKNNAGKVVTKHDERFPVRLAPFTSLQKMAMAAR
jgi:hypothetical protein